ncbi:ultraviolet-B receptor UVR8 isoform X2 [Euphorbia lathyris]|uniref:ultraviolet-B receptor UVR8 isoform X2 n=1 Tax=Euphorbia lathyris TaxID=212925 RepID=UPI003313F6C8
MEENYKTDGAKEQQGEEQEVWSWGAGTEGQLGTGKLEDEHLPQLLHLLYPSSAGPISTLACGGAHVIALTSGGKVLTWGRGTSGELGHGELLNSLHPKPVNLLDDYFITHVSAGWSHSGFVSDSGCLFTCGDGSFGQLGHGDYQSHSTPVKVSYFADRHVEQIACGMRHSLVLLKDCSQNLVYSFGAGKRHQLGISKGKVKSVGLPQVTCGFEDVEIVSISANGDHSAALSGDGNLYIWGRGFPGTSDVDVPHCLISSSRFVKVALGWNHALVLSADGEVFILGGDRHGALCDLDKISSLKNLTDLTHTFLERVSSIEGIKVVEVAAGAEHSALLTADGSIMTWGWGEHGQLGLGNTSDYTYPQPVSLGANTGNQDVILRVYCGSGFTFATKSPRLVRPDCIF